jgi:hypothetical protein
LANITPVETIGGAAVATWTPVAGTARSQRGSGGGVLSPAHKINDESDDEQSPETDIHKHLQWYFRLLIAAQARQTVGTLPHLTQFYWEVRWSGTLLIYAGQALPHPILGKLFAFFINTIALGKHAAF